MLAFLLSDLLLFELLNHAPAPLRRPIWSRPEAGQLSRKTSARPQEAKLGQRRSASIGPFARAGAVCRDIHYRSSYPASRLCTVSIV